MFNKHLMSRNIKSCYLKLGVSSPSPSGSDTKWYNRQLCLCCGCEMSKQISEVTRFQKYVPKVSAGYLASVCNMCFFFWGGATPEKLVSCIIFKLDHICVLFWVFNLNL